MSPPGEAKRWGRTWCRLAAALCGAALGGVEVDRTKCNTRFQAPEPGSNAVSLNGVHLPDTCINTDGPHEVFIIGDWGGIDSGDPAQGPVPADHRKSGFHKRDFVEGIDDRAQHAVRDRMVERASEARPEYVLNVGDNFYWAGVEMRCGATRRDWNNFSWQWDGIYENFYAGEGLDGVQWLGVLGNHDYGGFVYSNGWDQAILYTWKQPSNGKQMRWMTPALYWSSTVHYLDFSVDYFFLDTNIYDAWQPFEHMSNNICSFAHNPEGDGEGDCSSEGGPADIYDCYKWFLKLWAEQEDWLHLRLSQSEADWQIVVTHFPPSYDEEFWSNMTIDYGIDLFITGHLHRQEVWGDNEENFLAPTVVAVSGGGGGITSDFPPNVDGDDQYGYMRMNLFNDRIEVLNILHTGAEGDSATAFQRSCYNCTTKHIDRNWERYLNGLERRGRLGDPTSTTSSTTSTSTGTTTTMTTSAVIAATESSAKPAKTAEETALAPAAATSSVPIAPASDPAPASSDSSASSSADFTAATTASSQAAATTSWATTSVQAGMEEVAVAAPPGGGAGTAPVTTSAQVLLTASWTTTSAPPGIEEVAVAPPPGDGPGAAPVVTSTQAAATASSSTTSAQPGMEGVAVAVPPVGDAGAAPVPTSAQVVLSASWGEASAQPGIEEVVVAPPPGDGAGAAMLTTLAWAAATASSSTTLAQPGIEEVAVAPPPGDGAGVAPVTTSVEVAATTSSATTSSQPGIKEVAILPSPLVPVSVAPTTAWTPAAVQTTASMTFHGSGSSAMSQGLAQQHNHTLVYAASQNSRGADSSPFSPGAPPEKSPWFGDGASRASRLAAAACVVALMGICALAGIVRGARRSAYERATYQLPSRSPQACACDPTKFEEGSQQPTCEDALIDVRDLF